MQHRRDRYVCHWHKSARERNVEKKQGSEEEKDKEKWEKDKNQHNSFPLISAVYNIKAITACLCQRVWNNTLVSGREMRWGRKGRRRKEGEFVDVPLHQLEPRLVAAVTNTRVTDTTTRQQTFLALFCLSQPHWYQVGISWLNVAICAVSTLHLCSKVFNMPGWQVVVQFVSRHKNL